MGIPGIYRHQCLATDCMAVVEFDDEPYCFVHSPNEGSSLHSFSAKLALQHYVVQVMAENEKGPIGNPGFF